MILSTIQTVVNSLSKPCAFIYGNLFEVNGDLDIPNLSEGKDIFFVYIAPLENTDETSETQLIHTTFPLQFFMMKRLQNPTIDYKSSDIDPVIDDMRNLSREFIHLLNQQPIIEMGNTVNGQERNGVTSWKVTSEYAWSDHHLFGVSVTCTVPIVEGLTDC